MEKKKVTTKVEDIKQQYEDAKKAYEELGEQLKLAQQEENDRKRAQLAQEKDSRKKEVDDALDNFKTLVNAYIKDYGSYSTINEASDIGSLFKNTPWSWWF